MDNQTAATALESLGNEKRLTLYRHLVRAGPAGLPVGNLLKVADCFAVANQQQVLRFGHADCQAASSRMCRTFTGIAVILG